MRVAGTFVVGGRSCEVLEFDVNPNKQIKETDSLEIEATNVKAGMTQFDAELMMRHWRDIPLNFRQNVTFLFLKFTLGSHKDRRYIRFEADGLPRELCAHAKSTWLTKDCRAIRFV